MQRPVLVTIALLALLLNAALFGFFYAWICSTMWGLDAADPRIAIAAMQAMNASVRNAVFAPVFFGTVPVLLLAAFVAFRARRRPAAGLLLSAGMVCLFGGVAPTALVNVPMNEALALVAVPDNAAAAARIWQDYSPDWQFWNQLRTAFTGLALCLSGMALLQLRPMPA